MDRASKLIIMDKIVKIPFLYRRILFSIFTKSNE